MKTINLLIGSDAILKMPKGMIVKKLFIQNNAIPFLIEMEKEDELFYLGFQTEEESNPSVLDYRLENSEIDLTPLYPINFFKIFDQLNLGGNEKLINNKEKINTIHNSELPEAYKSMEHNFKEAKSNINYSELKHSKPEELIGDELLYIRYAPFSHQIEIVTKSNKIISMQLELIDYTESWMLEELKEEEVVTSEIKDEFSTHAPNVLIKRIERI